LIALLFSGRNDNYVRGNPDGKWSHDMFSGKLTPFLSSTTASALKNCVYRATFYGLYSKRANPFLLPCFPLVYR
jgi:hypothetical protein